MQCAGIGQPPVADKALVGALASAACRKIHGPATWRQPQPIHAGAETVDELRTFWEAFAVYFPTTARSAFMHGVYRLEKQPGRSGRLQIFQPCPAVPPMCYKTVQATEGQLKSPPAVPPGCR